jgi:putative transposase
MDNLHKLSRKLINENQVVCVESLKVKNMIRNPKLSKHIADASWAIRAPAPVQDEWAGRTLVAIDQFFPSSKRCSGCGYILNPCLLMFVTGYALNAAQTMIVTLTRLSISKPPGWRG